MLKGCLGTLLLPLTLCGGKWINSRLESKDVLVPPERAHDSDVTDEISELVGLVETPSWRSAAGPHMHAGARGGGKRRPVAPHSRCCPSIRPRVRVHVKLELLRRMSVVFVYLVISV